MYLSILIPSDLKMSVDFQSSCKKSLEIDSHFFSKIMFLLLSRGIYSMLFRIGAANFSFCLLHVGYSAFVDAEHAFDPSLGGSRGKLLP